MTSDKLGRQLKDLRISVTDRCNFRCPYCMPSEIYGDRYQFLPKDDLLTFEEITRLASIFANLGVNKIRITGGEPLVRNSVEELIANLSYIPEIVDLTMTTNGYLLPQKAQLLKNSGLNRITISLDTLDEDVFRKMNGRNFGPDRVVEGIKSAEKAGKYVRSGKGPYILEVETYRYRGHSMSDPAKYRSKKELDSYKNSDPIEFVEKEILKKKIVNKKFLEAINKKIISEMKEAVDYALNSEYPDSSSLYTDVYI